MLDLGALGALGALGVSDAHEKAWGCIEHQFQRPSLAAPVRSYDAGPALRQGYPVNGVLGSAGGDFESGKKWNVHLHRSVGVNLV
jgi:hypothetical protein